MHHFICRVFICFVWLGIPLCQGFLSDYRPDPDIIGMHWAQHPKSLYWTTAYNRDVEDTTCKVKSAWHDLYETYTYQSIRNFQAGKPQGMFVVHGMECILGAQETFLRSRDKYIDSSISLGNCPSLDFRRHVSPDAFVEGYLEHILSHRMGIACSLVGMSNDQGNLPVTRTFAKCGFILRVPPQCVISAQPYDACSDVVYNISGEIYPHEAMDFRPKNFFAACNRGRILTPDAIVNFPLPKTESDHSIFPYDGLPTYIGGMNEIFVAGAAIENDKVYSPEVVGVYINELDESGIGDFGNYRESQDWVVPIIGYAKKNDLPIVFLPKPKRAENSQAEMLLRERAIYLVGNKIRSYDPRYSDYICQKALQSMTDSLDPRIATYRFSNTERRAYGLG